MVPEHIISLPRFPTNANGKIDVKSLPEPVMIAPEEVKSILEPRNELQSQLSVIFESLLKKKVSVIFFQYQHKVDDIGLQLFTYSFQISITDDFFSFGGNSLLAMLAVQKIESELSLTFPLIRFFQLRTIAKIAESLQGSPSVDVQSASEVRSPIHSVATEPLQAQPSRVITRATPTPSFRIPLSPQQRHLWFQYAFDPSSNSGDIAMKIKISDVNLIPRFQSIINTLIMANDGLRTTMIIEGSLPVQYALSATECYHCIREKEGEEKLSINNRIIVGLSGDGELLIRLHHILVDGRSLAILNEQMGQLMEGKPIPSRRSFLQYCSSASHNSSSTGEWKHYLSDCKELRVPMEKTGKTGHGTVVQTITLDTGLLAEFIEKCECTSFHLLIASFISTLHQLSTQNDFIIGVVHAGRTMETHDIVGLFVNSLPVRVKIEGTMTIESAKEILIFPFTNCTSSLGEIVQAVNPKRIAGRHPLFQHVINFQNMSGEGDGTVDYEHTTETAFDTCWKIEESEGGFVVRIDYNQVMFREEFVKNAARMFEKSMKSYIQGGQTDSVTALKEADTNSFHPYPGFNAVELVRSIWMKHLNVAFLTDDDNFFEAGGHSLIALAVINELSGLIGKEVPIRYIFEHQTLDEFTRCIQQLLMDTKESEVVKTEENSIDPLRIRASHLQVPLLEHMKNNGSESFVRAYNITACIRIKKATDREEIRLRFNRLCLRHPSLRTFFVFDGVLYQRVVSATECYLPIGSPLEEDGAFDVFDCSPIAVSLQGNELCICISHLNVDGHSMKTLVKELADFNHDDKRESAGSFNQLNSELEMRSTAAATSFWKKTLNGFVFNPLRGCPRSSKTRLDAGSITKEYPELGKIMSQLCSTHHCTPFSVLLSSLGATLQRHSLKRDTPVSIGWPVDMRSTKTEKVMGFATNTLVTTVDSSSRESRDLISCVSQQVIGSLEHRATPFDELLNISGASTLFDTMLVMDPFSMDDGDEFEVIDEKLPFTKFPLTFFVQNSLNGVKITAHFMKDLFHSTDIQSILDEWEQTLICWASGRCLDRKSRYGDVKEIVVARQGQFVRVDDLAAMCMSIGRCQSKNENGRIVVEYDASIPEKALIDHIKFNVPLCLHPDELRKCTFAVEIPSSLPLTPQQLQMYFLSREDSSGNYNVPFVQRFSKTSVNVHHLALALHHVRQRNEALRTRLVEEDGEPVQIVLSATESYYSTTVVSLTEGEVQQRLNSTHELTLDLAHSPARLTLFDTGKDVVLLLIISHVICDGWSTSVMQQQLSTIYENLQMGHIPKMSRRRTWKEYNDLLQSTNPTKFIDEGYLKNVVVSLPEKKSALEIEGGKDVYCTLHLDKPSSVELNKRAVAQDSTPFSILLQSFAQSIHQVFGTKKLSIGTPVANRSSSTIDMIGCFMNTVVIPVHVTDPSQIKSIQPYLALNVPNFHLLKAVRSRLNQSEIRLFDVFVNCRYGMESEKNVKVDGVKKSEVHKMTPIYPLEFYVEEEDGEYEIEVKMKRGNEKTIEKLAGELRKILSHREGEAGVDNTNEKETSWTSTSTHEDIPSLDLASILHYNAQLNGDGLAIHTPSRKLSYSELWTMLSRRAVIIRDEFFTTTGEILRADDVIGVRMEHGEG